MFPLPEENHWVIVRAIAYSGHPDWKHLLRVYAHRMPTRQAMIYGYLSNQSPTLFQVASRRMPTTGQKVRSYFSYDTYFGDGKKKGPREELEPSPELLDTYWGYYFASGRYRPVARIVAMLPYSNDGNSVELLTLGNMAKFTLASNAVRDAKLLAMLKETRPTQPKPVAAPLKEVITAAEQVETSRLRKEAMASIDELRRKGPQSRRDASRWGQIGIGALALGCIGAAAVGAVALGLPCVVGGAMGSAGLKYYEIAVAARRRLTAPADRAGAGTSPPSGARGRLRCARWRGRHRPTTARALSIRHWDRRCGRRVPWRGSPWDTGRAT